MHIYMTAARMLLTTPPTILSPFYCILCIGVITVITQCISNVLSEPPRMKYRSLLAVLLVALQQISYAAVSLRSLCSSDEYTAADDLSDVSVQRSDATSAPGAEGNRAQYTKMLPNVRCTVSCPGGSPALLPNLPSAAQHKVSLSSSDADKYPQRAGGVTPSDRAIPINEHAH